MDSVAPIIKINFRIMLRLSFLSVFFFDTVQEGPDTCKWKCIWSDLLMEACPIPLNNLDWKVWERSAFLATFLHIFCTCTTPSFLAYSCKVLCKARQIATRKKWEMLSFPKIFPRSTWALTAASPRSFARLSNQAASARVNILAVVFLNTQIINNSYYYSCCY